MSATFFAGRWVEVCECGCGTAVGNATREETVDGKRILIACDTAQNRAWNEFKMQWQRDTVRARARSQ